MWRTCVLLLVGSEVVRGSGRNYGSPASSRVRRARGAAGGEAHQIAVEGHLGEAVGARGAAERVLVLLPRGAAHAVADAAVEQHDEFVRGTVDALRQPLGAP